MSALEARFGAELRALAAPRAGDRLVVALSGGLDSVVLLHLLRFGGTPEGVEVVAAHLDHAMRASSHTDADWVRGLCVAWGVPLHVERAAAAPVSEEEARRVRYRFLERVRASAGGTLVLTAHHADDQAETVLFRAVRGTGQAGLAGIPPRREPGVCRPLLGFWREELQAYAERARLSWREDPTNAELGYARNAIRHRILPEIERLVAPGARGALLRLAELAREDEAGWASVLPALMDPLRVTMDEGGLSLHRGALRALHPAVQARILRHLAGELGVRLDERATRRALGFVRDAPSGRTLALGGGCALRSELDRLVVVRDRRDREVPPDLPLLIHDVGPGSGEARIAGERVPVVWDAGGGEPRSRPGVPATELFDADTLRFPLTVRARAPGDRIRLPGGTKKVKKLLLERRIPPAARPRAPLVVDAEGAVLWIPGVARAEPARGGAALGGLRIVVG